MEEQQVYQREITQPEREGYIKGWEGTMMSSVAR